MLFRPVNTFFHLLPVKFCGTLKETGLFRRLDSTSTFSLPAVFKNAHTSALLKLVSCPRLIALLWFLKAMIRLYSPVTCGLGVQSIFVFVKGNTSRVLMPTSWPL